MSLRVKQIIKVCFVLYGILMMWLLFGQRIGREPFGTYREMLESSINLMPFHTIRNFINAVSRTDDGYMFRFSVINLAGNVVMFIPLGFFVPCVFSKFSRFGYCMLFSAICITAVELIQLFTLLGSCDIDDLILNMIGSAVGYGMYFIVKRKIGDKAVSATNI